jgi:predicted Zn-dependent protease
MLGLCEFELGDADAALRHIQRGRALGISNGEELGKVVLYHEGILLERKGKFQAAREDLAELCREGVEQQNLLLALGMTALRIREPRPSAQDSAIIAQVGRAECASAQKKFDQARQAYESLTANHSQFPRLHFAYGECLLDANDIPAAVKQFEFEIAANPGDVISRLKIAAAEYKVNSGAALPYASQAVKLDPHLPFAHYLLGLLLLDTGDSEKAIPELQSASRSFPEEKRLYLALSSAYAHVGRTADSQKARAKFIELNTKARKPAPETSLGHEEMDY